MKKAKRVILTFTKDGEELGRKLKGHLDAELVTNKSLDGGIKNKMDIIFSSYKEIIFISSTGIAVRLIAPYLKNKYLDPAVVVMDDLGKYIIPILSGHIGGANNLSEKIEVLIGAKAVITTASDGRAFQSLDLWARDNSLNYLDKKKMTQLMTSMVNGERIEFYDLTNSNHEIPNYEKIERVTSNKLLERNQYNKTEDGIGEKINRIFILPWNTDLSKIDDFFNTRGIKMGKDYLDCLFIEKRLVLGLGMKKGTDFLSLHNFVQEEFTNLSYSTAAIRSIVSIDLKKEEEAIHKLCEDLLIHPEFLTKEELMEIKKTNEERGISFNESAFVKDITGISSVSEVCALAYGGDLLIRKKIRDKITLSLALCD